MKYVVVGAGGTGGSIAAALAHAQLDVTLIARGDNYLAMREHGLKFDSDKLGKMVVNNLQLCTEDDYQDIPDVVFVAVKGYSLAEIVPFLQRVVSSRTIVIPILNIYGTGQRLGALLSARVLEGCMYIVAYKKAPGEIVQSGSMFRIIFGTRGEVSFAGELAQIAEECKSAGIDTIVSTDIGSATFRKFSFISPYAATGAYFNFTAGEIRANAEAMEFFRGLTKECLAIGRAEGINLPEDMLSKNLQVLHAMGEQDTASLQKDLQAGRPTEMDGLFVRPWELGHQHGILVPYYTKVVEKFGLRPSQ